MTSSHSGHQCLLYNILKEYGHAGAQLLELRDKGKKTVWQVNSKGKKMILKKMPSSPTQTGFITEAANHLLNAGVRVPKLLVTNNNENFITVDNTAYILMEWVDGKQPDYTRDTKAILSALAAFHRGSSGFKPSPGYKCRSHLGTWLDSYQKKKKQLQTYTLHALKNRDNDEFWDTFLHSWKLALKRIDQAMDRLEKSNYRQWVALAGNSGALCHQDFTPKNLRMQKDGGITVFDLDSVTIDIPARDLRKIFNKFLKKPEGQNQVKILQLMASVYQETNPLTKEQWAVVTADLLFPHLLYGIVDKYYHKRAADWSPGKYLKKLKHLTLVEENKEEILSQFLVG
ncbi:CotS family spore coat protein [Desulfallas thermosapovorans]|uniref:Spore coat-associated protein S n=1 Tax=Desulfallas thermosapovorans DSM 6562 TaxID=1121431 RepID=A0A5S4ZT89_9FIRM|nr:CotS family spore coat protein [Desulfallas thermosapovorans]TYO95983.1 spore coat-associated protein S [Desulfallas thermosapovorans DSM 6562]